MILVNIYTNYKVYVPEVVREMDLDLRDSVVVRVPYSINGR